MPIDISSLLFAFIKCGDVKTSQMSLQNTALVSLKHGCCLFKSLLLLNRWFAASKPNLLQIDEL